MSAIHDLAERIRRGEHIPPPLATLLTSLTPLTRAGMWIRKHHTPVRVSARVISFGNITAGGTGKTPAVIERAIKEMGEGRRVAVLTRGYGSKSKASDIVTATNLRDADLVERIGEEPALILRKVSGLVVGKGADRAVNAQRCIEEYGCETLILDDGFQYLRLERDENVLVVDAMNPFGNGRLIPRGILREPLEAIARATRVILTRCDQARDLPAVLETLRRYCAEAPIRTTRHTPAGLWRVADGAVRTLEELEGVKAKAVCAIGNPESFFATLESLGCTISDWTTFPDHADIPDEALRGPNLVIITEKDAVRLKSPPENVYALSVELRAWP